MPIYRNILYKTITEKKNKQVLKKSPLLRKKDHMTMFKSHELLPRVSTSNVIYKEQMQNWKFRLAVYDVTTGKLEMLIIKQKQTPTPNTPFDQQ